MFWYDHDPGGWGRFGMSVAMILFWAVLITVCILLARALPRSSDTRVTTDVPSSRPAPDQLLAERFARGEIDDNEYHRRLAVLRGQGGPPLDKS
jgi:putative membrane protein